MKEMQIFENQEFGAVRTVELDGEPWLVGKDVAQALGYSDTDQALRKHVDEEDKKILTRQNDGLAGGSGNATFDIPNRGMTIINESGLYSLVLSSKLPGAKKFRRWVTAEVLPAIVDAVGGRMTILVDGSIRTGMDVFKALALGADAVLIGRPFVTMVYGAGAEGVKTYVEKLKAELADTMAMCGAHSLADISRSMLYGF